MAKVKEQLKIGVVGLGGRGTSLLEAVMIPMEDISIIGVCDKYEDRRHTKVNAFRNQELLVLYMTKYKAPWE